MTTFGWRSFCVFLWVLILAVFLFWLAPHVRAQTPVQGAPQDRATVNGSVVITTGNTFQTILSAVTNNSRKALTIQNNNASDSCWVFVGAATPTKATSILLLAGGSYARYWPFVPSDVIQATCATSSDTLYVDTQ